MFVLIMTDVQEIAMITAITIWVQPSQEFYGEVSFLTKKTEEKFGPKFQVFLYNLYIFTSPSA